MLLKGSCHCGAVPKGRRERRFRADPRQAIFDWHRRRGLLA